MTKRFDGLKASLRLGVLSFKLFAFFLLPQGLRCADGFWCPRPFRCVCVCGGFLVAWGALGPAASRFFLAAFGVCRMEHSFGICTAFWGRGGESTRRLVRVPSGVF